MDSEELTWLPLVSPARTSPWRAVVRAWLEHGRGYGAKSGGHWLFYAPFGSSVKMCPACSPPGHLTSRRRRVEYSWTQGLDKDGRIVWWWKKRTISGPSSTPWGNSGMGGPTERWTLGTSEWPSAGVECSLSAVLETQPVPARYYLSPKAASGILRRAEKRGKQVPPPLAAALESVAGQPTPTG